MDALSNKPILEPVPKGIARPSLFVKNYRVDIVEVNGQAAVIIRSDGQALFVLTVEVEADHIQTVRIIANPEKLARV